MLGSILAKVELFCPSCGFKVAGNGEQEPYCHNCGTVIDECDETY